MTKHPTATRNEWLARRLELLEAEKDLTRRSDEVARRRQELPWVKIEKPYVFAGPEGGCTLDDLFGDRSQLAIYHFMLAPGSDHICPGCSYTVDHVDAARQHFEHADLAFAAVSRAPIEQIEAVTSTAPVDHWVRALREAGVPCGAIQNYEAVFNDPHLRQRGFYPEAPHPTLGPVRQLASPMRLSDTPVRLDRAGPLLGEHTQEILDEIRSNRV